MWDMGRAEPALIQPGFRVRFRDLAAAGTVYSLPGHSGAAADADGMAGDLAGGRQALDREAPASAAPHACFEVLAAGLQPLVQDLGRPGLTGRGVSLSGALDRGALRTANRIVGNPATAPVL